jgi:hypothetical protein
MTCIEAIWVAITKHFRLSNLYKTEINCSLLCRLGSPGSIHWQIQCLTRAHLHTKCLLYKSESTQGRGEDR